MRVRYSTLFSVLLLGVSCAATLASKASAQEILAPEMNRSDYITIPEAFDRALTRNSSSFQENRRIYRQVQANFGLGAYRERQIARDAALVSELYQQVLEQQNRSDRFIRTLDLPNPFDTSVRQLPSTIPGSRVLGSELVFERLPLP
ncbi:hypothetical protein H6G20_08690 [Desertifilum sp. FACHB-1129]|uniref:DUF4168 domain-containing protein n=1 Tax=Desertifilum tharense IPPAS B-1220 TaxID=1781255 RepID=A0A1E5QHW2_9CYAN|nr:MULTISPECIES: hypothetical protein [Cyanophyceae]MCD8486385.1 hypothetical protein [Desertifilum sp.]MDA0212390.1 hypothetical protein [Cyanobacteria bacterium FC1]MDI9641030.1 hypothetical protein [Geitlerinema splendidum]MBD2311734.1 hypothetical protein [Desertifilum sp. FACHB-1129]MBD2322741.1 hypothetical protein [Desertifilum sp. FACHB-866]